MNVSVEEMIKLFKDMMKQKGMDISKLNDISMSVEVEGRKTTFPLKTLIIEVNINDS